MNSDPVVLWRRGIAPSSVPSFIGAQVLGGVLAVGAVWLLYPGVTPEQAAQVVVPHDGRQGLPAGDSAGGWPGRAGQDEPVAAEGGRDAPGNSRRQ